METSTAGRERALDPQYEAYRIGRTLVERGASALTAEEVAATCSRLPGADAGALLTRLAAAGGPEALGALESVARKESRSEVRNRALYLLAQSPRREDYAGLFLEVLQGHPGDHVAATAVKALGATAGEVTFGAFKPYLTHADGRVRANCVEGLRYRSLAGLRPVLELLLDDPCPRVRAEAALSLWKLGQPALLQLLRDAEEPRERRSYLRALGRTGCDARVLDVLWETFRGSDAEDASVAAESLLELVPGELIPKALGMALYGPSVFRVRVFPKCLDADPTATVAALIEQIRELAAGGEAHARSLSTALSLLAAAGEVGDLELVVSLLESGDPRVAANAIEVLARRAEAPNVRGGLVRALRLGTPRMRVNAAVALWKAGMVAAVSELKAMLADDDPRVRAGAVWGLGTVGGLVGSSELPSMLSDPDERVRSMASRFV